MSAISLHEAYVDRQRMRDETREPERLALLDELCNELSQLDRPELLALAARAAVSPSTLYRWTSGTTLYGRTDTIERVGRNIGWRLQWNKYPYT